MLEKGNIRCTLNILPNNADTRRYTHYLYSNLSSKTFHGLIRPNYEPLPSLHHAIAKMRNIIEQQRKCGYTTVTMPMCIDNDDNNIYNTASVKADGVLCNTIQRSIQSMRGGTDPVIQCITNPDAFYSLLKKLNYNYRKLPPAEAIVSNALQAINVLNAIYNKINHNTANTNVLHINSDYLESHTFFELSALFYNLIPHSHSPFSSIHNICIDSFTKIKQKLLLLNSLESISYVMNSVAHSAKLNALLHDVCEIDVPIELTRLNEVYPRSEVRKIVYNDDNYESNVCSCVCTGSGKYYWKGVPIEHCVKVLDEKALDVVGCGWFGDGRYKRSREGWKGMFDGLFQGEGVIVYGNVRDAVKECLPLFESVAIIFLCEVWNGRDAGRDGVVVVPNKEGKIWLRYMVKVSVDEW